MGKTADRLDRIEAMVGRLLGEESTPLATHYGDVWIVEKGPLESREVTAVFSNHQAAKNYVSRERAQFGGVPRRIIRFALDGPEHGWFITEAFD